MKLNNPTEAGIIQADNPRQALSNPRLLGDLTPHEFSTLTEPHRRELQVHCYRMLGALQDAEDLVQETLLRAWQRRETYAARASLRVWLYKIATNLCLDTLERRKRRTLPTARQKVTPLDEPIPPEVNEPIWLEPFPDALLPAGEMTPEACFSMHESISLAFLVLLQQLPPRQRAVLTLRDVLDWQAGEVAELLELTVPTVKSLLFRARRTLVAHSHVVALDEASPTPSDPAMRVLLDRYTTAWEKADIDELVALLKEDATFSMPPIPAWYQGRKTIGSLVAKTIFRGDAQGRWRLQLTSANGQLAFGLYKSDETDGLYSAYGIQIVTFECMMIADITTFRVPTLFPKFNLPTILASD